MFMSNVEGIFNEVFEELKSATSKFGSFGNSHEGCSVIREEFEELWDAVKDKKCGLPEQRKEAIQVAAMAIRFIYDICPEKQES